MRISKWICVLMMTLTLTACGGATGQNSLQEQALAIRGEYLAADGCGAKLRVTADYGQRVYTYTMDVTVAGDTCTITLTAPEELAGITARATGGESRLEYDGAVVETGPLDADGLTPLSAVPELLECARSGFIDSCGTEQIGERDVLRMLCRDPEQPAGSGQETTLWFDMTTHALVRGEIAVDGYRVILCDLEQFTLN